jgi:hypothetical protein
MGDSGVSINGSISYDERDLSDESDNNQSIYTNTANTFIAIPTTKSGSIHDSSPSTKHEQYQHVNSNLSIY